MKNITLLLLLTIFLFAGCGPQFPQHEATRPDPQIIWINGRGAAEAASSVLNAPLFIWHPNDVCAESDDKMFADAEIVILIRTSFVPFKSDPVPAGEPRFVVKLNSGLLLVGPAGCVGVSQMVSFLSTSKNFVEIFNGTNPDLFDTGAK